MNVLRGIGTLSCVQIVSILQEYVHDFVANLHPKRDCPVWAVNALVSPLNKHQKRPAFGFLIFLSCFMLYYKRAREPS